MVAGDLEGIGKSFLWPLVNFQLFNCRGYMEAIKDIFQLAITLRQIELLKALVATLLDLIAEFCSIAPDDQKMILLESEKKGYLSLLNELEDQARDYLKRHPEAAKTVKAVGQSSVKGL